MVAGIDLHWVGELLARELVAHVIRQARYLHRSITILVYDVRALVDEATVVLWQDWREIIAAHDLLLLLMLLSLVFHLAYHLCLQMLAVQLVLTQASSADASRDTLDSTLSAVFVAEDVTALSAMVPPQNKGEVMLAVLATLHHRVVNPVGRVQTVPERVLFLLILRRCHRGWSHRWHRLASRLLLIWLHVFSFDSSLFRLFRCSLLRIFPILLVTGRGLIEALVYISDWKFIRIAILRYIDLIPRPINLHFNRHLLLEYSARSLPLHIIILWWHHIFIACRGVSIHCRSIHVEMILVFQFFQYLLDLVWVIFPLTGLATLHDWAFFGGCWSF